MLDNLDLIHMNGRVYDNVIGRSTSADPFIGTLDSSQGRRGNGCSVRTHLPAQEVGGHDACASTNMRGMRNRQIMSTTVSLRIAISGSGMQWMWSPLLQPAKRGTYGAQLADRWSRNSAGRRTSTDVLRKMECLVGRTDRICCFGCRLQLVATSTQRGDAKDYTATIGLAACIPTGWTGLAMMKNRISPADSITTSPTTIHWAAQI